MVWLIFLPQVTLESTNINFVTDTIDGITANFYDFDPSANMDTRQRITIPEGGVVAFSLQWDDPFFTTNGVDTDLDVFLLNAAGEIQNVFNLNGEEVKGSVDDNISSNTPLEFFQFTNNTQQTDFDIAIALSNGTEPARIKYIPFGLGFNPATIYQEFATNSPTIFGQQAATNSQSPT